MKNFIVYYKVREEVDDPESIYRKYRIRFADDEFVSAYDSHEILLTLQEIYGNDLEGVAIWEATDELFYIPKRHGPYEKRPA